MFLFRMSLVVSLWGTQNHNLYSINAGLDVIYFSCTEQNGIKYTDTVYTCKICTDMLDTQLSDSFRFGSIIEAMKIHVCWVKESVVDELQTLTLLRQDGIQHWLDVGDCFVQVFSNVGPQIVAISTEKSHTSLSTTGSSSLARPLEEAHKTQ